MMTRSRCCLISGCPVKVGTLNSTTPELREPLRKSIFAELTTCFAFSDGTESCIEGLLFDTDIAEFRSADSLTKTQTSLP